MSYSNTGEERSTEGHTPLIYLASLCATLVEENQALIDKKYGSSPASSPSAMSGRHAHRSIQVPSSTAFRSPPASPAESSVSASSDFDTCVAKLMNLPASGSSSSAKLGATRPIILIPQPLKPGVEIPHDSKFSTKSCALAGFEEGKTENSFISASSMNLLFEKTLQRVRRNSLGSQDSNASELQTFFQNKMRINELQADYGMCSPSLDGDDDDQHDDSTVGAPSYGRRRNSDPTSASNRLHGKVGLPFACFCCECCFATDEELVVHSNTHMNGAVVNGISLKRTNQCPVCGKSFSKNAHLTSHLRIHTGEKPFQCRECGKQFTQKSTLNRHSRVHTGEKPFECTLCGKRFAQQSTLTSHTRTHTGERPFQCDICLKRFNKSGHLYRHKRIVHAPRPGMDDIQGSPYTSSLSQASQIYPMPVHHSLDSLQHEPMVLSLDSANQSMHEMRPGMPSIAESKDFKVNQATSIPLAATIRPLNTQVASTPFVSVDHLSSITPRDMH